jgi:hypothetical protein
MAGTALQQQRERFASRRAARWQPLPVLTWQVGSAVWAYLVGCPCGNLAFRNSNLPRYCGNTGRIQPLCRTNLTGEHREGLPCHSRDEPASKRNVPAASHGACRPSAANPLGNARLPQGHRPLCKTNLSGEHTEGLPRHGRDEPASKPNAPVVPRGLCRPSAANPLGNARLPRGFRSC